ncbi:MAG TPA: MFS transporter, partial [Solirubrobacteraceae bacterium]
MEVIDAINEARLSRFHSKAIFVSGMGFFTDAYDLFIIGVASTLLAKQWHLSATQTGLINSMTLLGAFLGACVLGRLADLLGRKRIAVFDASMMLAFALASAVAPSFIFLVGFRFLLGLGVGGDYPVSAVLMSEYANRRDRGRLVGLVFAMQALGTVAGYTAGLVLLSAGVDHGLVWRILLGLGAVPSALVLCARLRMPESPRYLAWVKGDGRSAADGLRRFSGGKVLATGTARAAERMSLRQFLSD